MPFDVYGNPTASAGGLWEIDENSDIVPTPAIKRIKVDELKGNLITIEDDNELLIQTISSSLKISRFTGIINTTDQFKIISNTGSVDLFSINPFGTPSLTTPSLFPGNFVVKSIGTSANKWQNVYTDSVTIGTSVINESNATFAVSVSAPSITGDLTGNVSGNVSGDLTGDVTGNLSGNVTGNITGDVLGNVTGDLLGNVTGDLSGTNVELTNLTPSNYTTGMNTIMTTMDTSTATHLFQMYQSSLTGIALDSSYSGIIFSHRGTVPVQKSHIFAYNDGGGLLFTRSTELSDTPTITGDVILRLTSIGTSAYKNITPFYSTLNLGGSSQRWETIYGATGNFSENVTAANFIGDVTCETISHPSGGTVNIDSPLSCVNILHPLGGSLIIESPLYPGTPGGTHLGNSSNEWAWIYAVDGFFSGDVICSDAELTKSTTPVLKITYDDDITVGTSIYQNYCYAGSTTPKLGCGMQCNANAVTGTYASNSYQFWYATDTTGANRDIVQIMAFDAITCYKDIKPSGAGIDIGLTGNRFDNIYCHTLWETSDKRKKKEIAPIELGSEFIKKLKPRRYKWINDKLNRENKKSYGLLAQDVLESLVEYGCEDFDGVRIDNLDERDETILNNDGTETIVHKEASTEYNVNYNAFIPVLIKAVQEQQIIIDNLNTRLNLLEKKINKFF